MKEECKDCPLFNYSNSIFQFCSFLNAFLQDCSVNYDLQNAQAQIELEDSGRSLGQLLASMGENTPISLNNNLLELNKIQQDLSDFIESNNQLREYAKEIQPRYSQTKKYWELITNNLVESCDLGPDNNQVYQSQIVSHFFN